MKSATDIIDNTNSDTKTDMRADTKTDTRLTLPVIRDRLDGHQPALPPLQEGTRQAAVSVVLKGGHDSTDALFILRAEKEGDPWSGQMAFPGGHLDATDESLRQAAERETLEELGLDLTLAGRFIGQIDSVKANPRGRNINMVVTPFVYELVDEAVALVPNHEVAEVHWGSLNDMHSGLSHTRSEFTIQGRKFQASGYGVGGEIVWGLTYRMLDHLFILLDPNWVSKDEG